MSNQPYILNYSNELVTFPAYETVTGACKISTGTKAISVTGHARDLLTIQPGDYLLSDTGDETSELRRITGVNRNTRKIIIDEEFTVEPLDTDIKIVKVQSAGQVCVYNNGAAVVYAGGEIINVDEKVLWSAMTGEPPITVYGTDTFQVANGDIVTPVVIEPDGQPLTRTNDTNILLNLTGTPATALLEAVNIEVAWTGTLADGRIASSAYWNSKQDALGYTPVPDSRTVNGHALTSNVTVTKGDVGLGNVEDTALSTWAGSNNIVTTGKIATYNGITTADNGVPIIVASVSLRGQTAAIVDQLAYAVPATGQGLYRISFTAKITTPASLTAQLGTFDVEYVDNTDGVTVTSLSSNINNYNRSATNTAAGGVISGSMIVDAAESTNITFNVAYASNIAGMAYKVDVVVEYLKTQN